MPTPRDTQQRALTIFEAVYGPEHPEVAITLGNLGNVQERLGELEQARATLRRALAIYGPEHPYAAHARSILERMSAASGAAPDSRRSRLFRRRA